MKIRFSDTQDKDQYRLVCTFGLLQGIKLAFRMYFQIDKVACKKNSENLWICIRKWLSRENKLLENSFPCCVETDGIFKCLVSSNIRMDFKLLVKPAQFCVVEAMYYMFPKEV